ncbi:MAG: sodium/proline symporter [Evtepia sp.]|uniref:sodium/proline symporter n=1 Tax=Evtepia sp. TaxID=2773933 RepID=UPI002A74BEDE|nr:sodium/proline symporter [Evtepia sp.]MDY3013958.1 sodium/proline symporter [Evtepia sp.]
MTSSQICIVATIVVYLIAMVLVGIYFSKAGGGSSSHEFYLGGRKLGPVVTAMSAEASDMSSYLLMGLPGLAYLAGVAEVGWTAIGLAIGTYLNWLIVAKRLRRYSAQIGAITIPGFFSQRYRDQRHVLSCISAIVILIFFVPYTASGFKAIGTLFSSFFGVDYHMAMIVGAIVVIGYTVLGGFLAVSTTDLIQSIVMTFALLFIVFFGIQQAGGWEIVSSNAASLPGYLNLTQGYDAAAGQASTYSGLSIASTLAWGLGYFGMPHILLRFMAIRNENELKTSRRIATVWVVISMFVAILIGIIGLSVTKAGKIGYLATSSESETIIIRLSELLSQFGPFFAVIAGLVLAGILASTMSTADSQLLTAASGVSQDLLQDFFGIKLSAKASMFAARATVIVIAIIGIFLAWDPNSSVFMIVSFAWAGFGGAFGPVMLFSLFWKRTTKQGALAGMIAGGAMVFIWKYLVAPMGGTWAIYELLPAFVVGCVAILVVSLATPAPSKEICDEFDEVGRHPAGRRTIPE